MYESLENKDLKTLLIFDNVQDFTILKYLPTPTPSSTSRPHLLITSRLNRWPTDEKVEMLNLHVLSLAEARELILKCHIIQPNNPNIDMLADMLGRLPLAITQAIIYILIL